MSFEAKGGAFSLHMKIREFIKANNKIHIISLSCYYAGAPFHEDRAILIYTIEP